MMQLAHLGGFFKMLPDGSYGNREIARLYEKSCEKPSARIHLSPAHE